MDVKIDVVLTKNTLYSDNNIIYRFVPEKVYTFYTISSVRYTYLDRRSGVSNLGISVEIMQDKYQNIFQRSYSKLDQVLASTLSIYSVFALIFQNLIKFFECGALEYHLIKKLYYRDEEKLFFPPKQKGQNKKTQID
jgi:hypothetical protein